MYVLLNGSFGVGKSHVARELRRSLPDSAIADPEWIGVLLQCGAGRHRSDFQHDPLWRRLAVTWPEFSTHLPTVGKTPAAVANLVMAQLPGRNNQAGGERSF